MKIATFVAVALVAFVVALFAVRARSSKQAAIEPAKGKSASDPKEASAGLRLLMLQGSRAKFGLAQTSKPTEPWGVVMDWGMQGAPQRSSPCLTVPPVSISVPVVVTSVATAKRRFGWLRKRRLKLPNWCSCRLNLPQHSRYPNSMVFSSTFLAMRAFSCYAQANKS